ncbi:MAG: CDP-diacylglycerol--serine O-phosphatidyltransferase [Flavisolibacter sp.]
MKQIPNFFTLLNLIFGCIAIVLMLQTGETIVVMEDFGATQIILPEKLAEGALFIFGAAVIDFLDGFLARLFKASSPLGKQLDSLCDVVSFGVAPGIILYQLLRMSYAQQVNGLDVSFFWLLPSFIFTGAVAWRLAKFNITSGPGQAFSGVPSPAGGLLIASFPLILNMHEPLFSIQFFLINHFILYLIILVVSMLMVSNLPMMALKFKGSSFKENSSTYALVLVAVVCGVIFKWLAVPMVFFIYIVWSLLAKTHLINSTQDNKLPVDPRV